MHKEHMREVISDGSNTQIMVDDTSYQQQLLGKFEKLIQRYFNKFAEMPVANKEAIIIKFRALSDELDKEHAAYLRSKEQAND